ncbi:glycosyltransferase [Pedobacter gandavensis]|uniref:glycosyltransferase family 2 protein n=1 Tax=Pedobacter gandavensis TaxID=2679963 RepID=UPI0024795844|nr:glycosyltransferase [Pedobacter gandavensis]WGQ08886.1 glycosyltransferase [Pedobacter gandavensis]
MTLSSPLISCICVTDNRPELLQKAINCFKSQNYLNKELVISYPKNDHLSKKVISNEQNTTLKIMSIEREEDCSLGEARNQAIKKSNGEYVCTWDDDDWHHPSRISYQYNSIENKGEGYQASILTRILLYDEIKNETYYSFNYTWEGTILCRKVILLQNQYRHSNQGEDSHVIGFLRSKKQLLLLDQAPFLYIYIHHGKNTWNYDRFKFFMSNSLLLKGEEKEQVLSFMN